MRRNKYLDKLAMTISLLGSPFIVLFSMFVVLAWHFNESLYQFYSYILVTGTFVILVPLAYLIENISGLKLIDLHLYHKEERQKALLVVSSSVLVGYWMLSSIGIPKPLLIIELVGIFNLIIISVITFKMKLSIHLAVLTIAATLVVYFLGFSYLPVYLLIIPLAWARYYRERHDLLEVLSGIGVSLIVTIFSMQILLR
ncbi:MAG: hypothetical protein M1355_01525 [Patescibacteria group bacterium]|nr:hypothetical protein [Patescibacteria group bacterium]MCL5093790.1 hypothetical protein [Patescibacteria group bacterium]